MAATESVAGGMECVVPARQVRLFSKMLVCISKISDEFTVDVSAESITFRVANQSLSAFCAFVYKPTFFDGFNVKFRGKQKFKIQSKLCAAVIHASNTAESLCLKIPPAVDRFVFELLCKFGIRKVFEICIEDCETVRAVYNRQCPHLISVTPAFLLEVINSTFLDKKLAEVTLTAGSSSFELKSYVDEGADARVMQTALAMQPADFEVFAVCSEVPVEMTFCLKEFRAALNFCDATNSPMSLHFERASKPLVLRTTLLDSFEADFVLATLVDGAGASQSQSQAPTQQQPQQQQQQQQQQRSTPMGPPPTRPSAQSAPGQAQRSAAIETQPSQATPIPSSTASQRMQPGVAGTAAVTASAASGGAIGALWSQSSAVASSAGSAARAGIAAPAGAGSVSRGGTAAVLAPASPFTAAAARTPLAPESQPQQLSQQQSQQQQQQQQQQYGAQTSLPMSLSRLAPGPAAVAAALFGGPLPTPAPVISGVEEDRAVVQLSKKPRGQLSAALSRPPQQQQQTQYVHQQQQQQYDHFDNDASTQEIRPMDTGAGVAPIAPASAFTGALSMRSAGAAAEAEYDSDNSVPCSLPDRD